jgi:hypothetical protein
LSAIDDIALITGVARAELADAPDVNGGSTTTQGDASQFSNIVRTSFGLDGSGVTIGIISDSFDRLGGAATDIMSGDLPVGTVADLIVQEGNSVAFPTDEGRAMMQIIHDIAPGATLLFHAGGDDDQDMAAAIRTLRDHGADIIVDCGRLDL